MSHAQARRAVRSQYFFVANDQEAFSVFGRSEVTGITRIRQANDVCCLVFFLSVVAGMLLLELQAYRLGNVLRLTQPIDIDGRLCGYDEGVEDKPLSYHPNPYNDMVVCVAKCPRGPADGTYTLPDGPMAKVYTRAAYPTAQLFGQHCLPLDLTLAKNIISVKSVQTEVYKALAILFGYSWIVLLTLLVPLVTSTIYVVMLGVLPTAAVTMAIGLSSATLVLVGLIMGLDNDALVEVPLYQQTHPLMLRWQPWFRNICFVMAGFFVTFLLMSMTAIARTQLVFQECVASIMNKHALITIWFSLVLSVLRILFIVHVCRTVALLMSIVDPVEVHLSLLGEYHLVERYAWSPLMMRCVVFYSFGAFWVLEFMSFANKYITAQVLCHNYFRLRARNAAGQELSHGQVSPMWYALYSLSAFHLGSVAYAALLACPCKLLRLFIGFFVPDRPNLHASPNMQHKIAYWLFSFPLPLIQLDLYFLRFFKDSVSVMVALKGYRHMDAAERVEGLLNRCRGKIPNLAKFTSRIDLFIATSVGLSSLFWAFFLCREPRPTQHHLQAQSVSVHGSMTRLFVAPEHSPLLALPVFFAFGMWIGSGMLHLVSVASITLTVCYCIDVEMAGGTETDCHYVPASLKEAYKDLGGGESERDLSEMIALTEQPG